MRDKQHLYAVIMVVASSLAVDWAACPQQVQMLGHQHPPARSTSFYQKYLCHVSFFFPFFLVCFSETMTCGSFFH